MKTVRDLPIAGSGMASAPLPEKLLTVKELAAVTRMSVRWIHEQTRLGDIPCYRLGRALRFDPNEVQRWLMENRAAGPNGRNVGR